MATIYGFQSDVLSPLTMPNPISLNTTSILVCPANNKRRKLYINNLGTRDLYVTMGPVATVNNSALTVKAASSWESTGDGLWVGDVSVIRQAGLGAENLVVVEMI